MSRRTGTVLAAVALWLAIVLGTSMVAWVAIDRAGRDAYLTDGARPELTQSAPSPTSAVPTGGVTTGPAGGASGGASSTSTTTASKPPASSRPHPSSTTPPRTSPPRPRTSGPSPSRSTSSAPSPSTPSPSRQTPRPATVNGSVSVTGGSVGVSCQGPTLTLRFATPRNGWSYTIVRGSGEVEVSFRQNNGEGESEVHAQCEGGVPRFETSSSDGSDDRGGASGAETG